MLPTCDYCCEGGQLLLLNSPPRISLVVRGSPAGFRYRAHLPQDNTFPRGEPDKPGDMIFTCWKHVHWPAHVR